MKTLFFFILALLIPVGVVSAADSSVHPDAATGSNIGIEASEFQYQRHDDTDMIWKNAFINQHSNADNSFQINSGELLGKNFNLHFLYNNSRTNNLPGIESSFPDHEYYEIGTRIKGDWGNITLSFDNSTIEKSNPKLPLMARDSFKDKPSFPYRITKKRTNGFI